MKRRPLVVRVSALCLSLALAGAYITYRVTNARRAGSATPAGQPTLAQPPRHFGGTKRAEVFEIQTPQQEGRLMPGSKTDFMITPRDLESKDKPQPSDAPKEPEFAEPPVSPR